MAVRAAAFGTMRPDFRRLGFGLLAATALACLSVCVGGRASAAAGSGGIVVAQASETLQPTPESEFAEPPGGIEGMLEEDRGSSGETYDTQRAAVAPCAAKIVGGCAALRGAWPSMATLHAAKTNSAIHCGGTVIDAYWILTAAHCVTIANNVSVTQPTRLALREIPAKLMIARDGVFKLGRAATGRLVRIAEIIRHPEYQHVKLPDGRGVLLNDIALIRLEKPSSFPRQALASQASMASLTAPGKVATITGFGDTAQGGKPSPDLLQVDVPIVSEAKCQTAYPMLDYQSRLCAGLDEGGADSCQGDSGGPLFVRDNVQQSVQVGIVSYGLGCAQPNAWGVYTSVGAYEGFIKQHVPNAVFTDQVNTALASGSSTVNVLETFSNVNVNEMPSQMGQVQVEVAPGNSVKIGLPISIKVTSSVAGRLLVFNRDHRGQTIQLFPNNFSKTTQAGRDRETIAAGQTIEIPNPDENFALRASAPAGVNEVIALIAPPNAKTIDLTEQGKDLRPIADFDGLIRALTERSLAAQQKALSPDSEDQAEAEAQAPRPRPPAQPEATQAQVTPPPQAESGPPPGVSSTGGSPTERAVAHRKYEIVP